MRMLRYRIIEQSSGRLILFLVILLSYQTSSVYSFVLGESSIRTPWEDPSRSHQPQQVLKLPNTRGTTTVLLAEGRRPWDLIRFVQQSSRFISPFPMTTNNGMSNNNIKTLKKGDILWKAGGGDSRATTSTTTLNDFTFAPLDDVVMGGASSSTFDASTGKWNGVVTDANNGGFIGIRSTPTFGIYDLSQCTGIQLKISTTSRRNGRSSTTTAALSAASDLGGKKGLRLKIVLRDSTEFNGIGWTSSVDLGKSSSTTTTTIVRVPFNKQIPTRFAKTVNDSSLSSFQKDQIRGVQLVYSKFEYDGAFNPTFQTGDFSIQLEEVGTY